MCWRKTSRHGHLPHELRAILNAAAPTTDYATYERFKDVYSSKRLKVAFNCIKCNAKHTSDFKHLNKRKVISEAICPKCVMKVATSDEGWRKRNSEAQFIAQNRPEVLRKNADGVSRFWRENPEKKEKMRQKVLEAQLSKETIDKYAERQSYNGRGISGSYLSKWGWLVFDSSYELAYIVWAESSDQVLDVKRGPILSYKYDGRDRQYFIDFEVTTLTDKKWVEVKSGYIGRHREKVDRLREKMRECLAQVRLCRIDKVEIVHEGNSEEICGFRMPRSSHRDALFKLCADKIIFANSKYEEKYGKAKVQTRDFVQGKGIRSHSREHTLL